MRVTSKQGEENSSGWFGRLKQGLGRTSNSLSSGVGGIFARRKLDEETLDELEDFLISADLGAELSEDIRRDLSHRYFDRETSAEAVREVVAGWICKALEPVSQPLVIDPAHRPNVILVIGVNGTGKTTTIGKLAKQFRISGKRVTLVAGDTFRAAAIDQLKIWGERAGCPVVAAAPGADAAGLAYEGLRQAIADGTDVLFMDTAGRLHNRADLMAELEKVSRVIKKIDASAPHNCLLVLDATTGQNALAQVDAFAKMLPLSGLIVTKLDGTARGGVLVAIAKRFRLPIHAIGIGEGIDDLRPFAAVDLANALVGLDRRDRG